MQTFKATVVRIGSLETFTTCDIPISDINAPIVNLFPALLQSSERIDQTDIKVICSGTLLDCSKSLSDIDGNTLSFILKPKSEPIPEAEDPSSPIPSGFMNRVSKHNERLREFLCDKKWLSQLLQNCPSVGRDPLAFTLLQDIKMLSCIFRDKKTVEKILSMHPSLIQALHFVNNRLLEEIGRSKRSSTMDACSNRPTELDFSLNQFNPVDGESNSDDDSGDDPDSEVDMLDPARNFIPYSSSPMLQPSSSLTRIGRGALHAALSSVQAQLVVPSSTSPSSISVPNSASSFEPMETEQSHISSTDTTGRWSSQLAQLAAMGITDTEVALQTLEATNGDVSLALAILFG